MIKKDFYLLRRNINVSHETIERLNIYYNLLFCWQNKMNLVSKNSLKEAEIRHFADSAQLYKFCQNTEGNILDFGSGAGFPGAVLSILGIKNISLVESSLKKCSFLEKVKKETKSNYNVINSRIENLSYINTSLIMSRALTSTKNLINLCIKFMLKSKNYESIEAAKQDLPKLLFLKGKNYLNELNNLPLSHQLDFDIHQSITSNEGKILVYKKELK